MSTLTHTVTHDVDLSTARRATRRAFEEYQHRLAAYEPRIAWKDDDHAEVAICVKGFALHGAVALHDHTIDLAMEIPWMLKPFEKRAMTVMDHEIKTWLARAHAGEV